MGARLQASCLPDNPYNLAQAGQSIIYSEFDNRTAQTKTPGPDNNYVYM